MSPDPFRKDPLRSRGLWIGAGVLAIVALLVSVGIVLQQRSGVRRQLDAQARELADLQERAEAVARAGEELVQYRVLEALRQAHPAVDALAREEANNVQLVFLHHAGNGSRGGHGFVVWNAERTRGVLVVSPLPELPAGIVYQLVGRSVGSSAPVALARFQQETAVPFTLPEDFKPDRVEVVEASESHPNHPSIQLLLTSAEAGP